MPPTAPDVGKLRHRLSYQECVASLDEMNEQTDAWTTLGTFWGHVEPLTGMEKMNAFQLKQTTSHKVLMRNVNTALPTPIKPSGRFLFEGTGRIFGIDTIFRVEERNAYLSVHCSELVSPQ